MQFFARSTLVGIAVLLSYTLKSAVVAQGHSFTIDGKRTPLELESNIESIEPSDELLSSSLKPTELEVESSLLASELYPSESTFGSDSSTQEDDFSEIGSLDTSSPEQVFSGSSASTNVEDKTSSSPQEMQSTLVFETSAEFDTSELGSSSADNQKSITSSLSPKTSHSEVMSNISEIGASSGNRVSSTSEEPSSSGSSESSVASSADSNPSENSDASSTDSDSTSTDNSSASSSESASSTGTHDNDKVGGEPWTSTVYVDGESSYTTYTIPGEASPSLHTLRGVVASLVLVLFAALFVSNV